MNFSPSINAPKTLIGCLLVGATALGATACHPSRQARSSSAERAQTSGPQSSASAHQEGAPGELDATHGSAVLSPSPRPRDPMLAGETEKDCGTALQNPHGVPLFRSPDATCAVCDQPGEMLPRCSEQGAGVDISLETLTRSTGKSVSLRGSFGVFPVSCTKAGGPCACNNHCWAPLRLMHVDTAWDDIAPEAPAVVLDITTSYGTSLLESWPEKYGQDGRLTCHGDEGSLCCPIQLPQNTRSNPIVATGTLSSQGPDGHYSLDLESLCLLDVPNLNP